MPATIRDIARACGTSKTTVSKVLTGNDERISEGTKRLIYEAMGRLNYRPSAAARALCTKRTMSIGFVTSRIWHMVSRPYYSSLLDSILDASTDAGQRLTLYNLYGPVGPHMDPLMFADGHCDGLIVLGTPDTASAAAINRSELPCVVINGGRCEFNALSIQIDNELAGYDATRYLVEQGHKRIGYLHMPDVACSDERLAGYRRALSESGIAFRKELVLPFDYDPVGAQECAAKMASDRSLAVTALFCVADEFALAAMHGIQSAGARVPEDISVIGLDGVLEAERSFPRLTTVSQSLHELGRESVASLLRLIESTERQPEMREWPTRLVVRDSVIAR